MILIRIDAHLQGPEQFFTPGFPRQYNLPPDSFFDVKFHTRQVNGAKPSVFGAFFLKLPNFVGFYYCDWQLLGAV